jgi:thiamine biosynthesis protein ThiI
MKEVISISSGEIVLKGKNRKYFENALISKIRRALGDLEVEKIYKEIGKTYVECNEEDIDEAISRIKNVFGIVYVSKVVRTEKNIENIEKAIDKVLSWKKTDKEFTFKVISSRADKNYPLNSPELNQKFGGYILKNYENAKVDVHNPEYSIFLEIRSYAYIYSDRINGLGGMPMGTNGKGLILLSGGIDSPVAAFMMARRGLEINAVHYHSYPYTSDRAEEKVLDLAKIVSRYSGPIKVFSVNILEIQRAIAENCDEKNMTIISRKFMMRIAEKISKENNYDALITGDNLGQVASQTIKAMKIIDKTTDMLVFRPLISMDKTQIIKISEDIGTYETSILPFDDCCTIFAPKHPNLNPTEEKINAEEEKLDIERLVNRAVESAKIIEIE